MSPPALQPPSPSSGAHALWEQLDKLLPLVRRAWRLHRTSGIAVGVVCAALTVAVVATRTPEWRSEAVVFYQSNLRPDALGAGTRSDATLLREMLIGRSRMEELIDRFGLMPPAQQMGRRLDAVEDVRNKISFRTRGNNTFSISFDGRTPEEAQQITAWLVEALVEEDAKHRTDQAKTAKQFLEQEKARAEEELKRKEEDQAKFLADHPEFALAMTAPGGNGAGASIRAESARATGADAAARARRIAAAAPHPGPAPAAPAPIAPPAALDPEKVAALARAEGELASAVRDLRAAESKYTEQHPDVKTAAARVSAAEGAVKRAREALADVPPPPEPKRPAPAGDDPYGDEPSRGRPQARRSGQAAEPPPERDPPRAHPDNPRTADIVALETEWARLSRDLELARSRNLQLAAEAFRAELAASSQAEGYAAQVIVIDQPYLPSIPTKRRGVYIIGGFLLTVLAALGTSLARAVLDDRMLDEDDFGRLGLSPVLGIVRRTQAPERAARG